MSNPNNSMNRTEKHVYQMAAANRTVDHTHVIMQGEPAGEAVWLPHAGRAVIVDTNGGEHWYDATTARQAARIGAAIVAILVFDSAAQGNIEECRLSSDDILVDLENLAAERVTEAALLEQCLDGADADRVDGWESYVTTLCAALPE